MIIRNAIVLIIAITLLMVGFYLGQQYSHPADSTRHPLTSPVATQNLKPQKPLTSRPISAIAGAEWQEYRQARDKVLHDNSDLMAKYQKLMKEAAAQEQALDAAMVEADPKVAPAIAKLEQLRSHNSVAAK